MPPRQGPPQGTRQWTGANRWTRSTQSEDLAKLRRPQLSRSASVVPPPVRSTGYASAPAPVAATPSSELASLTDLVKHMHQALLQSGILKEPPPKHDDDPNMAVDLRAKRVAEQQLTPAHPAVADE